MNIRCRASGMFLTLVLLAVCRTMSPEIGYAYAEEVGRINTEIKAQIISGRLNSSMLTVGMAGDHHSRRILFQNLPEGINRAYLKLGTEPPIKIALEQTQEGWAWRATRTQLSQPGRIAGQLQTETAHGDEIEVWQSEVFLVNILESVDADEAIAESEAPFAQQWDAKVAAVDALTGTLEQRITDLTDSNADYAEVTDARGSFATLGRRISTLDSRKADKSILPAAYSGSPKGVYATVAALETAFPTGDTGVYLVTADGYLYSWSGSAWTQLTQYQTTGIAEESIERSMLEPAVDEVLSVNSGYEPNEYAYAIMDESKRMALGVKQDGTVEMPKAILGAMDATSIAGVEVTRRELSYDNARYAVTDETSRKSELILDGSGNVPDSVLERWKERMTGIGNRRIVCWGDSLTQGAGGNGTSWPGVLSNLLSADGYDYAVYNFGVGGEDSNTIAARQGGQVMLVNNITIPATTTAVQVATYASPLTTNTGASVKPLRQGGGTSINPCTIAGVEGTLSITQTSISSTDAVWSFTRSASGDAVMIDRPTPIITSAMRDMRGGIGILYVGNNGGWNNDIDAWVTQIRQMAESGRYDEYLVLALTISNGTETYYARHEAALQNAFGRRFLNHRKYLVEYGLADAGITATPQDTEDIAAGTIPTSLRTDAIHLNAAGYTVVAQLVYDRLAELGCLEKDENDTTDAEGDDDMAIITKLPVTFTDTTLPKLKLYDPIETNGSLFLLDMSHPLTTLDKTGAVSAITSYPNILEPMTEIGPATTTVATTKPLDSSEVTPLALNDRLEWTGKGGVHWLYRQMTGSLTDNSKHINAGTYALKLPETLYDYFMDNLDHKYYFSQWGRVTRGINSNYWTNVGAGIGGIKKASSNWRFCLMQKGANLVGTDDLTMYISTPSAQRSQDIRNDDASYRFAMASTDADRFGTYANGMYEIVGDMTSNDFNYSANTRSMISHILYRYYVEDLTVSGRTYEEVKAIDDRLYTKEVLTTGGRYYGDTWTDPETVDVG